MLVKEFPLTTAETSHTFDSPTIYKFITIFNNSTHELTFFSDESINNRFMLFSVSPFQYVTYPLEVMGTVATCTRLQKFTFTTIQRVVTPPFAVLNPNVRILLSEENFNVNNYQQANSLVNVNIPSAIEPVRTSWSITGSSPVNDFLFLTIPPLTGIIRVVTAFEVTCSANLTQGFTVDIQGTGSGSLDNFWRTVFMAGEPAGTRKGATGLLLRGGIGGVQRLTVSPAGADVTTWASMHGYNLSV